MWTYSCHRFASEAAYLAAVDAAGIADDQTAVPDVVGLLPDHAGWHVNMAWYMREIPEAFAASVVTPANAARSFAEPEQPEPPSLADTKAAALRDLDAEHEALLALGVPFGGKVAQIDPGSQARMAQVGAMVANGMPLGDGFTWRMADNTFLPLDTGAFLTMAARAAGRVHLLLLAYWDAKDAIRAAKDHDAVRAVKAAWPT